jgi:hypothetical protein
VECDRVGRQSTRLAAEFRVGDVAGVVEESMVSELGRQSTRLAARVDDAKQNLANHRSDFSTFDAIYGYHNRLGVPDFSIFDAIYG